MALKIPEQDGRIVQATEVPKSGMGGDVARPLETQKVGRDSFGDYSGDMEMAQVIKQVGAMAEDTGRKMVNLKIAEENDQLQRMMEEIDTTEKQSQIDAKQVALDSGVSVEEMAEMYKSKRDEAIMSIKDKYRFETMVGNDVDQRIAVLSDRYNIDYDSRVVMPARVEKVKAGQVETIKEMQKNLSLGMSMFDDPINQAAELQKYVEKVGAFTSNPAVVAVFGSVGAAELRDKAVLDATRDAVTEMVIKEPELMVNLLGTPTGDPATDAFYGMDPSLRKTLLNTATAHRNTVRAENQRALREKQEEVQAQLSMAIARRDPEMLGPQGMNKIAKLIQEGVIADRNGAALYSQIATIQRQKEEDAQRLADRRLRRAEIDARKQERASDRYAQLVDRAYAGDKSAANQVWIQIEKQLSSRPPEERIGASIQFAQETGVVPRGVESDISRSIFSPDAKVSAGAVQWAKQLKETSPVAYEQMDPWIKSRVTLGERYTPEQATKIIDANRRMTKDQQTTVGKSVEDYLKKKPASTTLSTTFDVAPGIVPPALASEYKQRVKDLALITGDIASAEQIATDDLQALGWGRTEIGGKERLVFKPLESTSLNKYRGREDDIVEHFEADVVKPNKLKEGEYATQWIAETVDGFNVYAVVNPKTMQVYSNDAGEKLVFIDDYSKSPAAARQKQAVVDTREKARRSQQNIDKKTGQADPADTGWGVTPVATGF